MATIPALYCHIPFCHTICPFCAFAVHGNRAGLQRPYLDALKQEIARAAGESFIGNFVRCTPSNASSAPATAGAVGTSPISPTPRAP